MEIGKNLLAAIEYVTGFLVCLAFLMAVFGPTIIIRRKKDKP